MRTVPFALGLLVLLATPALQAAIYKHVDANGKVSYTDQPPHDAEAVDLPPANVLNLGTPSAPAEENPQEAEVPAGPVPYTSLVVDGPTGTLTNPTEAVSISATPEPALQKGHQLVLLHNGKEVDTQGGSGLTIPQIDRGEHTFVAEIRDSSGKVLIRSTPHVFVVFRPSVLMRKK